MNLAAILADPTVEGFKVSLGASRWWHAVVYRKHTQAVASAWGETPAAAVTLAYGIIEAEDSLT